MQAAKYPVLSMWGQALAALFRARTHLHPVTILVFLLMAFVSAGIMFSVVEKTSLEIYVALTRLSSWMMPLLIIFVFWAYRRFRLRPLGEKRPVVAFLQMLVFSLGLTVVMGAFTLAGGVSIIVGSSIMGAEALAAESSRSALFFFAVPALLAGFLLFVRLMPGLALAARGEGIDLPRTWGVLHGNYWRFFATVVLFNLVVSVITFWGDAVFTDYAQHIAINRDFNVPQFYVYVLFSIIVHLWSAAGLAFMTSRACDLAAVAVPAAPKASVVETPAVATVVKTTAKPAAKKKAAPKKAAAKKPVTKPAAKKAAVKKPAAKKPAAKKAAVKKAVKGKK